MRTTFAAAVTFAAVTLSLAVPVAPPATATARTVNATRAATLAEAGGGAYGPRGVRARSAVLADMGSGRVLWSRRAGVRRPIGSIAKVMTAVVVLREGRLDRTIRVRPRHVAYAAARHGTTARLRPGDRITARELLSAMMLPSGCDAAAALADAYGPGRGGFLRKMNRTARALGLRRTRYADESGLPPAPGNSTARDQVVLGRYAMGFPLFRRVVGQERHVLRRGPHHRRYVWRSTNDLMGRYPGLLGIKSGYTSAAGYCLLFAARRGGRTLVGVVLHSSRTRRAARFQDARRMLDWGFRASRR